MACHSDAPRRRQWLMALAGVTAGGHMAAAAAGPAPVAATQRPRLTPEVAAGLRVLDRFVGTWDVTLDTQQPRPGRLQYPETYRWVLAGHYLQGDTGVRPDGTQDLSMGTFDPESGGYPFWIFSSTGAWFYLAPGPWDEDARRFRWTDSLNLSLSYDISTTFPDDRHRRWQVLVKDWKGQVLLAQRGRATRRPG